MIPTDLAPRATYYGATRNLAAQWPMLEGEVRADVCIIGGGFSGVVSALELAERGRRVVLLEARQIGWGASGRNGGQLIRGLGHDLQRFAASLGSAGVAELERLGEEAVALVRERIERHRITCDLRWGFCELANTRAGFAALRQQAEQLQRRGYPHPLRLVDERDLSGLLASDNYRGALVDMGSGHLHPLNLLLGEAEAAHALGVSIHERSAVHSIRRGQTLQVRTDRGSVEADHLIVACNAYLGDLVPELAGRVLPAGSYLIASEPLGDRARELIPQDLAFCDQRVALDYFRLSADGRLLFGGACHYSGRDPADIASYMRPKMLRVFPQLADVRIDYQWGGMIGIGANRLPQIGRLPTQPNIYYAQGYAGHGLNVTHLAGRLLAEAICEEQSSGFDLFASIAHPRFPGGTALRSPLLALGMLWYRLKEALGGDRLA